MKRIDLSKESINDYREKTRPKRQENTQTFFIFVLLVSFLWGWGKNVIAAERSSVITTAKTFPETSENVFLSKNDVEMATPLKKSNCSLPNTFPASELQSNWENVLSFCEVIERVSLERGFEPELIASLIMLESGGDPSAISQSGAIGIMQIMSSDGLSKQLFGDYFSSRPTVVELLDPKFNVEWGTSFLASLLKTYGNDIREALLHYGPANVGYEGYADKVLNVYKSIAD